MSTILVPVRSSVVTVFVSTIFEAFLIGLILFRSIEIFNNLYESWKLRRGHTLRLLPAFYSLRNISMMFAVLTTILFAVVELGINGIETDRFQKGTVLEVTNSTVHVANNELLGNYRKFLNTRLHPSMVYKGAQCIETDLSQSEQGIYTIHATRLRVGLKNQTIPAHKYVPIHVMDNGTHDVRCGGRRFDFRFRDHVSPHNCSYPFWSYGNASEAKLELIVQPSKNVVLNRDYLPKCLNLGRHEVYFNAAQTLAAYTTSKADSAVLMVLNTTHSTVLTIDVLEQDHMIDYGAELVTNWIHRTGRAWELMFSHVINSVYDFSYYIDYRNSSFPESTTVFLGYPETQYTMEPGELVVGKRNVTEVNYVTITVIIILVIVTICSAIAALFANSRLENYNLTDLNNVAKIIMSTYQANVESSAQEVILAIVQNEEYDSLELYKGGKTGRREGYPLLGDRKYQ